MTSYRRERPRQVQPRSVGPPDLTSSSCFVIPVPVEVTSLRTPWRCGVYCCCHCRSVKGSRPVGTHSCRRGGVRSPAAGMRCPRAVDVGLSEIEPISPHFNGAGKRIATEQERTVSWREKKTNETYNEMKNAASVCVGPTDRKYARAVIEALAKCSSCTYTLVTETSSAWDLFR